MPRGPLEWRAMPSTAIVAARRQKSSSAFAMLFLCLAAMFMTGSRGAVVLSLLALIVAFIAFFRRDLPRRSGIVSALAGAAQLRSFCCNSWEPASTPGSTSRALADEGRLETYKATLRMIADHPWFGTGQGTFAYAFPPIEARISRCGGSGTSPTTRFLRLRPTWACRSRRWLSSPGL